MQVPITQGNGGRIDKVCHSAPNWSSSIEEFFYISIMQRIKGWGGLMRFIAFAMFLAPLALAESSAFTESRHPLIANQVRPALIQTETLTRQAGDLLARLRDDAAFRAELKKNPQSAKALALLNELTQLSTQLGPALELAEKAKDDTQAAMAKLLDQFETDSGKRLGELAASFKKTLGQLRGESEVRQKLESETESDPVMDRLGPWLAPVVRAYAIEGGPAMEPVVELFELSAASSVLIRAWMQLSQVTAVSEYLLEELTGVAEADRERPTPRIALAAYIETRNQLQTELTRLRTLFPNFPVFSLSDFREKADKKPLVTAINAFIAGFAHPDSAIDKGHLERLNGTIRTLLDAFRDVESYGVQAFPYLANEDESKRLTLELLNRPEFLECAAIAKGEASSELLEGQGCDIKGFRAALHAYTRHHEKQAGYGLLPALLESLVAYEDDIKAKKIDWKTIEARVEEEVRALSNLNSDVYAAWQKARHAIFAEPAKLEALFGQGLALHDYIAAKMLSAGVNPLLGLDAQFESTLFSAKDIVQGLKETVPEGVERVERLSSTSDCKVFTNNDKKNSPFVVWTQHLASFDQAREYWTHASPSTHGFQRLLWRHRIRVGNAVNLPPTEHPQAFLAGSLRWTAMSRYIPNLVLLKLFTGEKAPDSLASLGVRPAKGDFDGLFHRRKSGPDYDQIITEARRAFDKMLHGFAENNPQLVGEEQDPATLKKLFRQRYRQELAIAAVEMRRWGAEYARLNSGSSNEERFNAVQNAPHGELCKLFGVAPEDCPADLERGTAISLMRDLFPAIKKNYCRRHKIKEDVSLTPEMFLEELVMHKGVIGGDTGVVGLEPDEIARYQMYTSGPNRWMTPETYRDFAMRISKLQKIHEHTLNIYERRKATLERMRQMLFHLFPPLKVDAVAPGQRWATPAWQWFEDDEAHFDTVMTAYTEQATKLINRVQALETPDAALDFLLPVLPLVDQTLRFFPENKKEVCAQQASRQFWEGVQSGTMMAGEFAGAAAMGLGPVGVAVGGGIFAVALTVDYMRLERERAELARTKVHELASWSQVSAETSANGIRLVDSMERAYAAEQTSFYVRAAITIATAGYSGIKNLAAIRRIPGALSRASGAYAAAFRAEKGWKSMRAFNQWRYWSRLKGRITQVVLRRDGKAWARLIMPLERAGLVTKWAHPTLAKLWNTPFLNGPGLWKVPINKSVAMAKWSWYMLSEGPASLVGRSMVPGLVNTAWEVPMVMGGVSAVFGMVRENLYDGVNEKFWDHLQNEPEIYEQLLVRVLNGELSPEGLRAVIDADLRYRQIWDTALLELKQEAEAEKVSIEEAKTTLRGWRYQIEASILMGGDKAKEDTYAFPRRQQVRQIDKLLQKL